MSPPSPATGPVKWSRGRGVVATLLALLSGCAVPVQRVCPQCARLVIGERPPVPPGTRTVVVIVPGLLGYGWEWNGAQSALEQVPGAAVVVHEWDPWTSVHAGGAQLATSMQYLLARLPRSVNKVVIISHSAGGLLAVDAAARLRVPPGLPVEVLVVGTPIAGNYFNLVAGADNFDSPLPLAMSGKFTHWPEPAPGVRLSVWSTSATDPVMKPHFGHEPADPRVLPRAATVQALPPAVEHNLALSVVTRLLASRLGSGGPRAPLAALGGDAQAAARRERPAPPRPLAKSPSRRSAGRSAVQAERRTVQN